MLIVPAANPAAMITTASNGFNAARPMDGGQCLPLESRVAEVARVVGERCVEPERKNARDEQLLLGDAAVLGEKLVEHLARHEAPQQRQVDAPGWRGRRRPSR